MKTKKQTLMSEAKALDDYWQNVYRTLLSKKTSDSERDAIIWNLDMRFINLQSQILKIEKEANE